MQNNRNRVARIAPKDGNWEAYFADKPAERCLGCTPEEALARLRFHATKCEKLDFAEKRRVERRPRMSLGILATVAIGGILTIVLLLSQQQPPTTTADHGHKIYAHHRLHNK